MILEYIAKFILSIFIIIIVGYVIVYGALVLIKTWKSPIDWKKTTLPNPLGFIHFKDPLPKLYFAAMTRGDPKAYKELKDLLIKEDDPEVKSKNFYPILKNTGKLGRIPISTIMMSLINGTRNSNIKNIYQKNFTNYIRKKLLRQKKKL